MDTRPTLDQTRESLFNILQSEVQGARVLDLFAGSGALGLEALSRGAEFVVFCDKGREALKALKANIAALGAGEECRLLGEDCYLALNRLAREGERFDLIFLDPPYTQDNGPVMEKILNLCLLHEEGMVVVERDAKASLSLPQGFCLKKSKVYGRTALDFITLLKEERHEDGNISRQL